MMPVGDAEVPVPVLEPAEPVEPLQELAPEPVVADPAEVGDQIREVVEQHLDPEKRKS